MSGEVWSVGFVKKLTDPANIKISPGWAERVVFEAKNHRAHKAISCCPDMIDYRRRIHNENKYLFDINRVASFITLTVDSARFMIQNELTIGSGRRRHSESEQSIAFQVK